MTRPTPMDPVDHIAELTRPHQHAERLTYKVGLTTVTRNHITRVPPLVVQLSDASPSGAGEDRGGAGYESRPAAALEALDTLIRIDLEAARWVRDLGEDDPGDTAACIRLLGSLMPSAHRCHRTKPVVVEGKVTCCTWHAVAGDVRRWWTQARIATGLDSPAWRPDNTCPMCGVRGSLRVKLLEQVAFCTGCHDTWSEETIGLLAEHMRAEGAVERRRAVEQLCWCPVVQPSYDKWPRLCPACGSPYCHRAAESAGRAS